MSLHEVFKKNAKFLTNLQRLYIIFNMFFIFYLIIMESYNNVNQNEWSFKDIVNELLSSPAQIDDSWCTMCALTCRINGRVFRVYLPKWDAFSALEHPTEKCIWTLPKWKEHELPNNEWWGITLNDFLNMVAEIDPDIADMAISEKRYWKLQEHTSMQLIWDLAVQTDSENWRIFGHRVLAFNLWSKWYVYDPYFKRAWKPSRYWIPLEEYMKTKKILKCNFYKSEWDDPTLLSKFSEAIEEGKKLPFDKWDDWKYNEVMKYVSQKDVEKTKKIWDDIENGTYQYDIDDVYQLIDANEWDLLYKLFQRSNLTLDELLLLFNNKKRQKKLAVFINMCRFFDQVDKKIQDEIINIINNNVEIRKYIDAASYYWILNTFTNLNYETKILLIDLAINQFKKDWNEEKWIRIYHFDEKYNSYTREKRNEYIKDLMEAKAMLTKNA